MTMSTHQKVNEDLLKLNNVIEHATFMSTFTRNELRKIYTSLLKNIRDNEVEHSNQVRETEIVYRSL
jgi:hypothetical protein